MTMATRRFYSVPSRVAVLGAGSFGSAMVKVVERALLELAEDSTSTTATPTISWYARRQSIVDEINTQQTNQQYFEGGVFDASIVKATTNLVDCVSEAQVVILAVPSNYLPPILQEIDSKLDDRAVLVSVLKSIHYDSEERAVTTPIDEIRRVVSVVCMILVRNTEHLLNTACDTCLLIYHAVSSSILSSPAIRLWLSRVQICTRK